MSKTFLTEQPQALTPEQQAQARSNIGAAAIGEGGGASPDAVLYTAQVLSVEQQAQARDNIGAASFETVDSVVQLVEDAYTLAELAVSTNEQVWTEERKAQARENIGAISAEEVVAIVDERLSSITNAEEVAY